MFVEDAFEDHFCEENDLRPIDKRRRKFNKNYTELEDEVFQDTDCIHNSLYDYFKGGVEPEATMQCINPYHEPNGTLAALFPESEEKYHERLLNAMDEMLSHCADRFTGAIVLVNTHDKAGECLSQKNVELPTPDYCGVS